jgi:hypothetical protein
MVLPGVTPRPHPSALDCRVPSAITRRCAAAFAALLIAAFVGLFGPARLHSLGDGESTPVRTQAVEQQRGPRTELLLTADQRPDVPLSSGDIVKLRGSLVGPPAAGT